MAELGDVDDVTSRRPGKGSPHQMKDVGETFRRLTDMEEDIRKKGMLYVQQQRFGKKWRKVWSILYRDSTCSISRLEFFECKDGASGTLEKSKCKQENKKIIRLSDCVRVSDAADVDGCPKECKAFLVETTEKTFVFAAETLEAADWKQKLCEIAFPMNRSECGAARMNSFPSESDVSMTDNSLYCGQEAALKDFKVVIRHSDAAERCGLKGHYLLRTDFDSLLLKDPKSGEVHFTWPYRFLRRFGRDKMTFSFEAGRRCDSGEGNFEFDTKQGNAIFQSVEAAINLQKAGFLQQQIASGAREREALPMPPPPKITPPPEDVSGTVYSMLSETAAKDKARQSPPHRARLETPTDKHLTGVRSLNLDSRPLPKKNQVKNFRSCPLANTDEEAYSRVTVPPPDHELPERVEQEEQHQKLRPCASSPDTEYSLPFDNVAKNAMMDMLASPHSGPPMVVEPCNETRGSNERAAEPLYDIIDESAVRSFPQKPKRHSSKYPAVEHIYDEPEGCAATPHAPTALYDDPEEVRGNAWKTLGAVTDPSGHEFPYNAHVDDYAVPKPPRRARIPQLEKERSEKSRKTGIQAKDEENSSPYDNVVVKMKTSSLNE